MSEPRLVMISFIVNGEKVTVQVPENYTLLRVLREELGLMGTKEGCGKGECGACTVIMNGQPVTSCIVLAPQADGAVIETIEGLSKEGELHPIQKAFVEEGAVQCGFCTPGFIMSAKALLDKNAQPTTEEIKEAISGNLCRCTGYVKIVNAIQKAAEYISEVSK